MAEAAGLHTGYSQEWLASTARLRKGYSAIAASALASIVMVTMACLCEAGEFSQWTQTVLKTLGATVTP